jgi:alpha-glucosidase
LLTYAANPANILANPAVAIIKDIPAVWDETIVLPGSEIGELAAYARRKGNNWFVAVMNGKTPKKITIPLKFLKTGNYNTTVVKDDGDNSASVKVEKNNYSARDTIELDLAAGGGYLAELVMP